MLEVFQRIQEVKYNHSLVTVLCSFAEVDRKGSD
jgi:hypothetical protein